MTLFAATKPIPACMSLEELAREYVEAFKAELSAAEAQALAEVRLKDARHNLIAQVAKRDCSGCAIVLDQHVVIPTAGGAGNVTVHPKSSS